MLGLRRLINLCLPISFLTILCAPVLAENSEHQSLFTLSISDQKPSAVLDFLSNIGIKNPYAFTNIDANKHGGQMFRQMIEQTYATNPDILISQDDIMIANEGKNQAVGAMLPNVSGRLAASSRREKFESSSISRFSGSGIVRDEFASGSLNMTQPLFHGGTLFQNVQKSKEALEAAKFGREAVIQNLFLNAITAHLNVLENLAVAAVSQHSLDVLTRFDKETQARFRSGVITRTDVSQSHARVSRAQADFDQAIAAYKKSRETFERIVGMPANSGANIPEIQFSEMLDYDQLEKIVLLHHPLIQQASKQAAAAQKGIKSKFGVLLPSADFILDGANNFKRGYQSTKYSGEAKVQLDIPIFSGGVDYSAYKQAKFEYQKTLNQVDRTRRDIRDNLNAVKYDFDIANQVLASRLSELQASSIAFEGAQKELNAGRRTVLDTLDLESELLNANIDYIRASFNKKKLVFQYLDAIGCLNHNILMQAIVS